MNHQGGNIVIDPYRPDPQHNKEPVQPVSVDGLGTFCGCEQCVEARQLWADSQSPLAGFFDPNDSEDMLWQDIGGGG